MDVMDERIVCGRVSGLMDEVQVDRCGGGVNSLALHVDERRNSGVDDRYMDECVSLMWMKDE